jgi:alkanesulfonate monooxygenase SsuD/methylene tetrahydromethanopterin reductase-like flavin-dependent oxidoreductase (luciferase family)
VLFTATASAAGTRFAGKHAEVVFTGGPDTASLRRTIDGIREAAVAAGRKADDVRFVSVAGVIVAPTEAEARAKLARYQELASPDGYLAHAGLSWDPAAFPPDAKVKDVAADNGRAGRFRAFDPEQTVGEYLAGFGDLSRHPLLAVGDPQQVAGEIERWLDEVGIDGINLLQYHSYDTARDFIDLVVPVLRERGRLRSEYDEHETLRDRISGDGDRLPERHHGARYRGGAHLPSHPEKKETPA